MIPSRTLDDLTIGQTGIVADIRSVPAIERRLLEMGLTDGVVLAVVRQAPLGDPIEIAVRGYRLTLRRDEARAVQLRT